MESKYHILFILAALIALPFVSYPATTAAQEAPTQQSSAIPATGPNSQFPNIVLGASNIFDKYLQTANAQLISLNDTTLYIPITIIVPITLILQNAQICVSLASSGDQTCQQIILEPTQTSYTPVDVDLTQPEPVVTTSNQTDTTTPTSSNETSTPTSSNETSTPTSSNETSTPTSSNETSTPTSSNETSTPTSSNETSSFAGNSNRTFDAGKSNTSNPMNVPEPRNDGGSPDSHATDNGNMKKDKEPGEQKEDKPTEDDN
jgi:hypothetical protein